VRLCQRVREVHLRHKSFGKSIFMRANCMKQPLPTFPSVLQYYMSAGSNVSSTVRVLEIGCGDGRSLLEVANAMEKLTARPLCLTGLNSLEYATDRKHQPQDPAHEKWVLGSPIPSPIWPLLLGDPSRTSFQSAAKEHNLPLPSSLLQLANGDFTAGLPFPTGTFDLMISHAALCKGLNSKDMRSYLDPSVALLPILDEVLRNIRHGGMGVLFDLSCNMIFQHLDGAAFGNTVILHAGIGHIVRPRPRIGHCGNGSAVDVQERECIAAFLFAPKPSTCSGNGPNLLVHLFSPVSNESAVLDGRSPCEEALASSGILGSTYFDMVRHGSFADAAAPIPVPTEYRQPGGTTTASLAVHAFYKWLHSRATALKMYQLKREGNHADGYPATNGTV
jgi:SAM-dependent methyltransferase